MTDVWLWFQSHDEDVQYKQDFSQPTLDDHFDKTILPKVMQVSTPSYLFYPHPLRQLASVLSIFVDDFIPALEPWVHSDLCEILYIFFFFSFVGVFVWCSSVNF